MPGGQARVRRYAAFIAVAGLHALIISILLAPRVRRERPEDVDVAITTLYFPSPDAARPRAHRKRRPALAFPQPPWMVTVPDISPPAASADEPGKSVDWTAEGQKVAAAIAAAPGALDDALPAPRRGSASSEAPRHFKGEQYQLETGEKIFWVSGKCYLISDPPDLFTPNAFAHSKLTRMRCSGGSRESGGDLFKDSAAYRKYHLEK
jgi:hypothetical protein